MVIEVIRGLSRSTRRGVKALLTSLRSRSWSGGSLLSMCTSRASYIESGSGRQSSGILSSRGSASAARASAYPVTSHSGRPARHDHARDRPLRPQPGVHRVRILEVLGAKVFDGSGHDCP